MMREIWVELYGSMLLDVWSDVGEYVGIVEGVLGI